MEVFAAKRFVGYFGRKIFRPYGFLRELPDTAQIGMGADAVVGDAQGNPDGSFPPLPFADDLHNPRLVGVANGDALATAVVTVLLHQLGHALDGLAGVGGALQGEPHQREVVEQPLAVLEFQPSVEGGLHDGQLLLVHQADHVVSVLDLLHELPFVRGSPPVDGDLLAGGMASGRTVKQRP